jgi:coagulation factor 5/8 type
MKTIFRKIFLGALVALTGMSVISCNDDDTIDPYDINYVYIYAPGYTNHAISYLEDGTFVKAINEEEKIIPVRCTRPAPNDLKITFSIDESLIDAYNKEHETNYVFLKNAQLVNPELSIKKGEFISADTLKIRYTDMSEFRDGTANYILPVTITEVKAGGVTVSESNTFYLTYKSTLILMEEADSPNGTKIDDRSNWSVLMNGKDTDDDGTSTSAVIDGNNGTYIYSESEETELLFDLKKKEQISSIALTFYAWYYAAQNVSVAVSADGTNYEELGNVNLSNTGNNIINLYKNKNVQFVKMKFMGFNYYAALAIKEINMYTSK